MKKSIGALSLGLMFAAELHAQDFTADQYDKALTISTRFFGGQRAGAGPNWLIMDSEYPNSFMKDSIDGRDITGGWFDCGDHVMFGQTQFYSSYVLAKAFDLWPQGFPDRYSSDYSGYQNAGDYSYGNGKPNGIPDLLDELFFEADFLVKITPNPSTFYSQKGEGQKDHSKWVTSGKMSTYGKGFGGDNTGSRAVVKNPNDASMPALVSATLAIASKWHPDQAKRALYLQHAKYAYEYTLTHNGLVGDPQFYNAKWFNDWEDAVSNAATELYKITGEEKYKLKVEDNFSKVSVNGGARMDYANDEALAVFNSVHEMGLTSTSPTKSVSTFIAKSTGSVNSEGVTTFGNVGFANRGSVSSAYLQALLNVIDQNPENMDYIYDQADYWLGSNSGKQSFLIGFTENGAQDPKYPHHRNVYLRNDDPDNSEILEIPARNKQFGALMGGSVTPDSYNDSRMNYSHNEPCLDINAPWVGLLGYIIAQLNPQPIFEVPAATGQVKLHLEDFEGGHLNILNSKAKYKVGDELKVVLTIDQGYEFKTIVANQSFSGTDTLKLTLEGDLYLKPVIVKKYGELVRNGTFDENLDHWSALQQLDGGAGKQKWDNGVYYAQLSSEAYDFEGLSTFQTDIPLFKGETYVIKFSTNSVAFRPFKFMITAGNGKSPYYINENLEIDALYMNHSYEFTVTDEDDLSARLSFFFGQSDVDFILDNVSLQIKEESNPILVAPKANWQSLEAGLWRRGSETEGEVDLMILNSQGQVLEHHFLQASQNDFVFEGKQAGVYWIREKNLKQVNLYKWVKN